MRLELFDIDEFVEINDVKEVTSAKIFERGVSRDPKGIASEEIFGDTSKKKRNWFGYIDLHGYYLHPHSFVALSGLFQKKFLQKFIAGAAYIRIKDGWIEKVKGDALDIDPTDLNVGTGLKFLYDNWDKIKWKTYAGDSPQRVERMTYFKCHPKNEIFMSKQLVIPLAFRDIQENEGGSVETDELNNLYTHIVSTVQGMNIGSFDFQLYGAQASIQDYIQQIYDNFKTKLEKKNGMIRKYLMGKNVDYCVRTVITCPIYKSNTPEECPNRIGQVGVPLQQMCTLGYPFMMAWLRSFFRNNVIENAQSYPIMDSETGEVKMVELYQPEQYFNDEVYNKMMKSYEKDPECRFDPIKIPIGPDKFANMVFTGRKVNAATNAELATTAQRPFTLTDLLYIASEDMRQGKHVLVTRYPVSDAYGLFVGNCETITTTYTEVVSLNGKIYPHYPKIDFNVPKKDRGLCFVDSLQFSNSFLDGLGGDYDGDQVTIKLIWGKEANIECAKVMNQKSFFISPSGKNVRIIKFECYQTMYDFTKDPTPQSKTVPEAVKKELLERPADQFTFEYLKDLFGATMSKDKSHIIEARFHTYDKLTLNPGEYGVKEKTPTTIGRLVWNKVMIDWVGVRKFYPYINEVLTKKKYNSVLESTMVRHLVNDEIDTPVFRKYIDHRDWFGLQLHGLVTCAFSEATLSVPPSVTKLKEELAKKYEKELKAGNPEVANKMEKALVAEALKSVSHDDSYDIYASGARADVDNNLKNLFCMRGGVKNPMTGEYEIMLSSFADGIKKEDFTPAANSNVVGAYSKSCSTADSGYLAKQLMAGVQTEVIGSDGSDCGTEATLTIALREDNIGDFDGRYINDKGKVVMITDKNKNNYIGKRVKLYSPMCCARVEHGKICNKCAGRHTNKLIGLDSNKIATTLTNLNMKKFHDSTIRYKALDIADIFINSDGNNYIERKGDYLVAKSTIEFYIPPKFFEKNMAENLVDKMKLFGLVPVGLYGGGKRVLDTLNIPSMNNYFIATMENRNIHEGVLDGEYVVLKWMKGEEICSFQIMEEADNAQLMLRQVTYGNIPSTIPYNSVLQIWQKNQKLNNVNFGVPSSIQETVLASCYRYKPNPAKKFGEVLGKHPDLDQYNYEMASFRRVCQLNSTFTGITFESFNQMVTTSTNRSAQNGYETPSPLEMLLKL